MAPGITSEGGIVTADLPVKQAIAVMAEGKQHAMAIGVLCMSSADIVSQNRGQAIEVVMYMNDSIWNIKPV